MTTPAVHYTIAIRERGRQDLLWHSDKQAGSVFGKQTFRVEIIFRPTQQSKESSAFLECSSLLQVELHLCQLYLYTLTWTSLSTEVAQSSAVIVYTQVPLFCSYSCESLLLHTIPIWVKLHQPVHRRSVGRWNATRAEWKNSQWSRKQVDVRRSQGCKAERRRVCDHHRLMCMLRWALAFSLHILRGLWPFDADLLHVHEWNVRSELKLSLCRLSKGSEGAIGKEFLWGL